MFKWLRKKDGIIDKKNSSYVSSEHALFSDEKETVNARAKKILIVEDNEMDAKLLTTLLEYHEHEVLQIIEGGEVKKHVHEFQPDLIVLGLPLPDMTGGEITKHINQDDALNNIPVIAITAFSDLDKEHNKLSGNADFESVFTKPINVSQFIEVIDRL